MILQKNNIFFIPEIIRIFTKSQNVSVSKENLIIYWDIKKMKRYCRDGEIKNDNNDH